MNKKILVIGDVMLDEYIVGENYHISDEAPVAILKVDEFVPKLGGAANVANNIKELGGEVLLCGAIGKLTGHSAARFLEEMDKRNLSTSLIVEGCMKTTTKSRVIIKNQQVARFDYEESILPSQIKDEIIQRVKKVNFDEIGIIVVSDYKKGIVCQEIMDIIKNTGINIVIDPKPGNERYYHDSFCLTPNLREFNILTKNEFHINQLSDIELAAKNYKNILNLKNLVITLGDRGALCCSDEKSVLISNEIVEVSNTIGAGDTFISALSYEIMNGKDIFESTRIANVAASIVVSKKYTGICSMEEVYKHLNRSRNE